MESKAAVLSGKSGKGRHGFLKGLLRFACVLLAIVLVWCAITVAYTLYYKGHYKINFYQETSKKVSGNIRLAVISDIHNREYGPQNEALLADLRALKPDLILFPGDMIIRDQDDYQPALDLISNAAAIAPCYGVLGNHESERIYFLDDKALPEKLENAGLILLRNAQQEVTVGRNTVQLYGVEGTAYGFDQYGGREFMEKNPRDPDAYTIVMAHIPVLFDPQLAAFDFDLGIAGHAHGGIVRLPFLGGLYTKEEGLFPKFTAGRVQLSGHQPLIISAGLGDSSFFLRRINSSPELVIIDINRY